MEKNLQMEGTGYIMLINDNVLVRCCGGRRKDVTSVSRW